MRDAGVGSEQTTGVEIDHAGAERQQYGGTVAGPDNVMGMAASGRRGRTSAAEERRKLVGSVLLHAALSADKSGHRFAQTRPLEAALHSHPSKGGRWADRRLPASRPKDSQVCRSVELSRYWVVRSDSLTPLYVVFNFSQFCSDEVLERRADYEQRYQNCRDRVIPCCFNRARRVAACERICRP